MNTAAMQAALDAKKRPCRYCGKVMRKPNLSTHEPACSPEAKEARRLRHVMYSRRTRSRPGWTRTPYKRDDCPTCGASKLASSDHCKACDAGGLRPRPLDERFWEKVDRLGLDDCWPWLGATSVHGYGRFMLGNIAGTVMSHRQAWILTNGPVPDGLQVCHRCDNPPCCNPAHLFLGTPLDNMRDMIGKGRAAWQRRSA